MEQREQRQNRLLSRVGNIQRRKVCPEDLNSRQGREHFSDSEATGVVSLAQHLATTMSLNLDSLSLSASLKISSLSHTNCCHLEIPFGIYVVNMLFSDAVFIHAC